jgi:hypothetical protein
MYIFVDFTSQIVGRRGLPCPTNKGVSYTNLVCWLGRDIKNRLLLLLLLLESSNVIVGKISNFLIHKSIQFSNKLEYIC